MAQTWFSSSRNGIPLRERPTPRTRPIAPHNAEETMPLTAEGHTRDPSRDCTESQNCTDDSG